MRHILGHTPHCTQTEHNALPSSKMQANKSNSNSKLQSNVNTGRSKGPVSYRIKPVQGDDGLVYGYLATTVDGSGRIIKSTYMTVDKVNAFFESSARNNSAGARVSNARRNSNNSNKGRAALNKTPNARKTSNNDAVRVKDATGVMQTAKTSLVMGAGATLGSMAVHKIFNWFDD